MKTLGKLIFGTAFLVACATILPRQVEQRQAEIIDASEQAKWLISIKMIEVQCPEPATLDPGKDYCPAIDIDIAPDGTVKHAQLVGPQEFLTTELGVVSAQETRKYGVKRGCSRAFIC